jgi:hypothetical protein
VSRAISFPCKSKSPFSYLETMDWEVCSFSPSSTRVMVFSLRSRASRSQGPLCPRALSRLVFWPWQNLRYGCGDERSKAAPPPTLGGSILASIGGSIQESADALQVARANRRHLFGCHKNELAPCGATLVVNDLINNLMDQLP